MRKIYMSAFALVVLAMGLQGCTSSEPTDNSGTEGKGGGANTAKLSGTISVDGSSTVAPFSEAFGEEFGKENDGVKVIVAQSGTGGGFKKFTSGEIDIAGASRPIEAEEIAAAKEKGVEFVEVPISFDGLSIVVNKENTFATTLTVDELKRIWAADTKVKTWKDVRSDFPAEPIKLYGPGTDSGTFDYFTEVICGKKGNSRKDYQPSEDDNVLVQGVAGDKFSLGYFGFAYYDLNKDKLTAVKVDGGKGPVEPTTETIANGTYAPLSRPLFLYVNKKSLDRPEVKAFLTFVLDKAKDLIPSADGVVLPDDAYAAARERVEKGVVGSTFSGAPTGASVVDLTKETPKQ
ncbi:MAG: PstS family phosphate ABC transporter substrate-binding protein [Fimbriimonadaceae bacterium]|nr:PstS family phosphate ABC transporter substrate-binding protein [Fimbriimonadaceae bacterium]